MITYEKLLEIAEKEDVDVNDEYEFSDRLKGLYCDGNIAIKKDLMVREKKCIMAEELGHHFTAEGNILDQRNIINRKLERRGKIYAYDLLAEEIHGRALSVVVPSEDGGERECYQAHHQDRKADHRYH